LLLAASSVQTYEHQPYVVNLLGLITLENKLNKAEGSINDRIKILIPALGLSARAFSHALEVSESTTRNYLDKGSKPSTDYIERIATHFDSVNLVWLITGKGELFLTDKSESGSTQTGNFNQAGTSNKQTIKGNRGTVQNNTGSGNTITNNVKLDDCKRDLEAAQRENEYLRGKLQDKEELLAAKDETITLLRASFNRPN
jgi:hypothetical protein